MSELSGILVVDDEKDFATGLTRLLRRNFPEETVEAANSARQALERLEADPAAVVLTDVRMPGQDGLELLERVHDRHPQTSVIMLTAHGSIEMAVGAVKSGAYDFLTKPIDPETLFKAVGNALERTRLLGENERLRSLLEREDRCRGPVIIGESPAMRRLRESIETVATTDYTVLITGESGTGKELVARAVHASSRRCRKPMVAVNCPAIPDQLLESELFGHVRGAFTGADRERKGLFLTADASSILLDEIGDISMNIQTKLLRCLQEQEVRPVGASRSIPVNVRILASTNQDLAARMAERVFREDLYYRLNVLTIQVPPLRERVEDIPLLAHHFMGEACREMGIEEKDIAPEALAALASRPWAGNVRELQNFVRRLAVFSRGPVVDASLVRLASGESLERAPEVRTYKEAKAQVLDAFTRTYAVELLSATSGNVSEAARMAGLTRVALQKILKRLEIEADSFRQAG